MNNITRLIHNILVGAYCIIVATAWTIFMMLLVLLLPFGHRTHNLVLELFSKLPEPRFK